MKQHTTKIFITVVVVAILVIGGLAIYDYQKQPHVTVQQAQTAERNAKEALRIHQQVDTKNEQTLQQHVEELSTVNTNLSNQKVAVCTQLKALKASNPACN